MSTQRSELRARRPVAVAGSGRQGPLRRVRRPLRARDLGAGARPAAGRHRPVSAQRGLPGRIPPRARDLGGPAHRPVARAHPQQAAGVPRSGSSARISRTPARTRSTTPWVRRCSPSASARSASSPRPVRGSTASRAPPRPPGWACPASSTWARSTSSARRRMSAACSSWARRSCPCTRARRPCAPPSMRRCATGSPIPTAPIIRSGSAVGPHPYPYLVRELQSVIGREARAQMLKPPGGLPDVVVACVGGGSNAIGLFHPFLGDTSVEILGIEAGGRGAGLGDNAASLTFGTPGVLQGSYTLILQDAFGQVRETHSVSAGLDYSGVGPEHAFLKSIGRVAYESATDEEALDALPSAPVARAYCPPSRARTPFSARAAMPRSHPGARILIGCSGRGDKDMSILQRTILALTAEPPVCSPATPSPRAIPAAAARRPPGAGRIPHRRLSEPAPVPRAPGRGRRRLRRGRDRRAILRSDGRRLDDTAGELRRAGGRRDPALDSRGAARAAADVHAPLLLMSYLNPLLASASPACRRAARAAGRVPASSCPTCPTRRAASCARALQREGLALVQMVTPVTPQARLASALRRGAGFRLRGDA